MFTKSKDEITYKDIKTFCQSKPEGARVEYKREIKDIEGKIPKVISSFANTYGGICVIGVDANQVDNRPTNVPGIPREKGIEERIQGSAWDGIHQPVNPQVILVDVPKTDNNIVVVIRVEESMHAPHAIEQGTKVYFRPGSISKPLYKLSDIDRIAHQLKRREQGQETLQRVQTQIDAMGRHPTIVTPHPCLKVVIHPVFSYCPLTSASDIYEKFFNTTIRSVSGGVAWVLKDEYRILNEYGIVYYRNLLSIEDNQLVFQSFAERMLSLLKNARDLYQLCNYLGSIEVNVELKGVFNTSLQFPSSYLGTSYLKPSLEDEIFLKTQCNATEFSDMDSRINAFTTLLRQLFLAYDLPDNYEPIEKLRPLIQQLAK